MGWRYNKSSKFSIKIYGGTLTATNGVQNLIGSTLTIGAGNNGQMGQITGNVTNNGTYIIDAKGAFCGGMSECDYTLITGTFAGNNATLVNGNSDFANATITDNKTLNIKINQTKISDFKNSLTSNERATLGRFGDNIYTTSGTNASSLKSIANGINSTLFSAFFPIATISAMESIMDSLESKKQNHSTNRQIRKISTKNANRNINQKTNRRVKNTNQNNINAGFIAQGIASNNANGVLGGINVGYGYDFTNAKFTLNFAYTYGNIKDSFKNDIVGHNITSKSHNFALNANLNTYLMKNFGFEVDLSGFGGIINHTRKITFDSIDLQLKSTQKIYRFSADLIFLYDCKINIFMISPYFGLNNGYITMPKVAELGDTQFAINANAYNAYFLSVIMGAKMQLDFRDYGLIISHLKYKFLPLYTQKQRILHYANSTDFLHFLIPRTHKIAFDLGYRKDFGSWYLQFGANFGALIGKSNEANVSFYDYGLSGKFGFLF